MTEHSPVDLKYPVLDETPEQAARAIAEALDFLEQEAEAVGMHEVRDLIRRASEMAKAYRGTR